MNIVSWAAMWLLVFPLVMLGAWFCWLIADVREQRDHERRMREWDAQMLGRSLARVQRDDGLEALWESDSYERRGA